MKKILLLILSLALLGGCSIYNTGTPEIPEKENIQEAENNEGQNNESEEKENEKPEGANDKSPEKETVMAPDFELESLDGSFIKLSEMRDKNVILNFWYTGCVFCVTEMPDLQELQNTYKDDLLLLAINVGEEKEVIREFMDENNLTFTVLLDQKMDIAYEYGIRSFPTTIAVNKNGQVVAGHVGMLTYEQMEELYGFFD